MTEQLVQAAERLIAAVAYDDSANGGLVSRETIRKADELRVFVLRWRRAR